MRKLRIPFICLFLSFCCCLHADEVDVREVLSYYQNMSQLALLFAGSLFEQADDAEERVRIARDTSYMMFTYWAETRIGQLRPSRKVDVAVQETYEWPFAKQKEAEVFKDPLVWLSSETPGLSPPKAISSMSKSEYVKLLDRYYRFLGISGKREAPYHSDEVKVTDELGYYENMSCLAFAYVRRLSERMDNAEERLSTARGISITMFTYWAYTRIGQLKPSRKVDVAVREAYEYFAKQKGVKAAKVFEDPMAWLGSKTSRLGCFLDIPLSKSEYIKALDRYYDFLGISKEQKAS